MNEFLANNMIYLLFAIVTLLLLVIVMFFMIIYLTTRYTKLENRFQIFISGKEASSLEQMIRTILKESKNIKGQNETIEKELKEIQAREEGYYKKVGIYRYDAFREIGGRLSFSLALLNDRNDGFLLSCMHGTEGCYTYLKEITHGEAAAAISEEEQKALDEALKCEK